MTRDELLGHIRDIPLGVALCDALDAHGVDVCIDSAEVRQRAGDRAFGLYAPQQKKIYLRDDAEPAAALHIFLHEARHALQICGLSRHAGYRDIFNLYADPKAFALNVRLREMDADTFAVYFLYVHAAETGSDWFDRMMVAKTAHEGAGRGALYRVFYQAWKNAGSSHADEDVIPAMQAVGDAWLASKSLPRSYDARSCTEWARISVPRFEAALADPQSQWRGDIHAHVWQARGRTARALENAALFYAGLLNAAGYPNYLQGQSGKDAIRRLVTARALPACVDSAAADHAKAVDFIRRRGLAPRVRSR